MSVSYSIHRHLSNLQTESAAVFALVLQVFLLWEEGSVCHDLRVVEWPYVFARWLLDLNLVSR